MAVVSALPEPNEGVRHGPRVEPELRLAPDTVARISAVAERPAQAWRSEPLARKKAFARRRGEPMSKDTAATDVDAALERIFQNADFLAGAWLSTGATKADAVAKINTSSELGTGFLVSPWLLMTNNHVIDSPETASGAVAWFRYVEDADGNISPRKLALQPERCFVTSPREALDYTVVAVAPLEDKPPGEHFGSIPLHGGVGKIVVGQNVNVIQRTLAEGLSSQLEFRTAETSFLETKGALLSATYQQNVARAEWDRATGRYFQFSKDTAGKVR